MVWLFFAIQQLLGLSLFLDVGVFAWRFFVVQFLSIELWFELWFTRIVSLFVWVKGRG